jgi:arabinogalactan endo-1,4-beta-galactosidase
MKFIIEWLGRNYMKKALVFVGFVWVFIFGSCRKANTAPPPSPSPAAYIAAVDISSYPEISTYAPVFKDLNGNQKDFLSILKEQGVNTVRLRLWVNPRDRHSGFNEVKQFSSTLKNKGFKIWLSLHYSDTWADPGQQQTPASWSGLNFASLNDSVRQYTAKVVREISPDFIQIGNEINSGFLHPSGHITANPSNFITLLQTATAAVRQQSSHCKIILHVAGYEDSEWFFQQTKSVDYDIMGLSFYPIWHGKSLLAFQSRMNALTSTFKKDILIAETAYPFTLGWNDWTQNIVGLESQLILPEFPATPDGQLRFIQEINRMMKETNRGIGFCYWGAELVAFKGPQSTTASPWENQALFDFSLKALPVLQAFKQE